MKMKSKAILVGAFAIIGGSLLFATQRKSYNSVLDDPKTPVFKTNYTGAGSTTAAAQPIDFEKAASAAVPSVVHIKVTMHAKEVSLHQGRGGQGQGDDQDPFGDMFKRFFGDGQGGGRGMAEPDQKASGSGVIISSDGYIVTNNHVVNGATAITVTLNNRKNYVAKVIGTDPNTDMALIKIDAKDLPVMTIGNSDEVK